MLRISQVYIILAARLDVLPWFDMSLTCHVLILLQLGGFLELLACQVQVWKMPCQFRGAPCSVYGGEREESSLTTNIFPWRTLVGRHLEDYDFIFVIMPFQVTCYFFLGGGIDTDSYKVQAKQCNIQYLACTRRRRGIRCCEIASSVKNMVLYRPPW